MKNSKNLVKAFQIFKEGMTTDCVTILINESDFTDSFIQFKISKYIYLGYTIKNI